MKHEIIEGLLAVLIPITGVAVKTYNDRACQEHLAQEIKANLNLQFAEFAKAIEMLREESK
jgi:hypothetical protein